VTSRGRGSNNDWHGYAVENAKGLKQRLGVE
jgi:hypothetical protein